MTLDNLNRIKHIDNSLSVLTTGLEEITDIASADCHAYLRMFAIRVQKTFPNCSFASSFDTNIRSLFVYHKTQPYVMGWIGYGNFRRNGSGNDTFAVGSRNIVNAKYAYGKQEHMYTSKNIEVVTKHARKYLSDWSALEVAVLKGNEVTQFWGNTDNGLSREVSDKYQKVVRSNSCLINQLKVLDAMGHNYVDNTFKVAVRELLDKHEEQLEKTRERSAKVAAITVCESRITGESEYLVCRCSDISKYQQDWQDVGRFDDKTLPEELAGKLSVLMMCEQKQWVDNVGVKFSDRVYYVIE